MMEYISSSDLLLTILFAVVLIVGFGFILLVFGRMLKRWDVRIAIDDGMTIHYVRGRIKGRTQKDGNLYYVIEYKDPFDKRLVEVLVPDSPGYMRLMRFFGGLHKYVVYRVDKSGQAISWETDSPVVNAEKLEHLKTHELIINALRSRIFLDKYLLYLIILVVVILAFTGIVVWKAMSRPIIVQVLENATISHPMPSGPVG